MGHFLSNVLRLGIKELRSLRRDPVMVLLIVYAFTLAVYSVANGARMEVRNAAVAVVDEDRSALSQAIAQAILPPYFKTPVPIAPQAVAGALDSGRFVFVLELPPDFEADLLAGRVPTVLLSVDATAMGQAGNGSAYLREIVTREVRRFVGRTEGMATPPVDLVIHAAFNPNLQAEWFSAVMQVITSITMLSVILTGAAVIREREQGTIEHLLVMPVTPGEIMAAKIWANGLVIVVATMLSIVFVVRIALGVPVAGSLGLFICGVVLYQVAVTALGIMLATFTVSMPQFGLLALPVLIVMNLLSGGMMPLESMPVWLQNVMQAAPATHFVAFAQAVLYRGAGLGIVWPSLLAIAGIGVLFLGVALLRFRRSLVAMQ
jgi:ABC-2 type transport system permease protein